MCEHLYLGEVVFVVRGRVVFVLVMFIFLFLLCLVCTCFTNLMLIDSMIILLDNLF